MRVKMCGMKTVSAALAAEEAGADYIGFVFAPSKRQVTLDQAIRCAQGGTGDRAGAASCAKGRRIRRRADG